MEQVRISFDKMKSVFKRVLLKYSFEESKAEKCADIFTTNSLEGVYSHGVYRFPRFIDYIRQGFIRVDAIAELANATGALEQWNGNSGPGPINAEICSKRAMEVASKNTIGCIALGNTNHWMRAGLYGWQAAKNGFAFIAWTNTIANMPAWGAADSKLGNNPLVFAVPYGESAIVLDFSMTQFSYGKMEASQLEGKNLPFDGGFNKKGELTKIPGEILETGRALPIGYWKGAGLSLLLDIFAAILSAGKATHEISKHEIEHAVSQVFIAIDLKNLQNYPAIEKSINDIINDFKTSISENETNKIRYPGERIKKTREENLKKGIPVNLSIWQTITKL
ncbi:3-dehydro-L-gulonate 2-dehydrogenase [Maribellus comscasis]|uniref:3-dehydro-L-gulonate 2-dehydrogenase n=1 Tax=Maribellus comscasis TaxID=2681766 RepID=A0A6I6JV81_9BACT|nr:3-dehydro-L-gulonate 2-dehydrogenase [Maribellus comscasis]QGY44988.1 3-dehydro-L-gulonate 2-dehydrogenase [Maribellus comscasis]